MCELNSNEPSDGSVPPVITPDAKDWTAVLEAGCPQCGWEPFDPTTAPERLLASIPRWRTALSRNDVGTRPAPQTWSPLEYGCHVLDVHRVFQGRLALMLGEDDPLFADWDQDAAAVGGRYWEKDPAATADLYAAETERAVAALGRIGDGDWARPSRRSNGARFTTRTFVHYWVHDIEHHLHDVGA